MPGILAESLLAGLCVYRMRASQNPTSLLTSTYTCAGDIGFK
jgi:hypothetical protein